MSLYSSPTCYKHLLTSALLLFACVPTVHGQVSYHFVVDYFGGSVANLAPGSNDPNGQALFPLDSFFWQINAQNGAFWRVDVGGDIFPLMAFNCTPAGRRTGNFSLKLFDNGVEVFGYSESDSVQSQVHIGTNTVNLPTDLTFDVMCLEYLLLDATEDPESGITTAALLPVDTILHGILPIFGTPEFNSGGNVVYVPELTSWSFACLVTVGGIMVRTVRRKKS